MEVFDWDRLSLFLGQALRQKEVKAHLKGTAGPMVGVSFGKLQLKDIPFGGDITLSGMNNFEGGLKVGKLDIKGGTPGKLTIGTSAQVFNPSIVSASLGSMEFDLLVNDTYVVGKVSIDNFTLVKDGWVTSEAVAHYADTDPVIHGHTFLSIYLCQRNQTVKFINPKATGPNARLLQKGIDGFTMETVLPGRDIKLMTAGIMTWTNEVWKMLANLPVVLNVNNPYSAAVTITGAHETITYTDASGKSGAMGIYTHCDKGKNGCADDLTKFPIVLEPNTVGQTPSHNVKTAGITLQMIEALKDLVCGGSVLKCKPTPIPITIGGWMDVQVGTFQARVNVTEFFDVHFTGLPVAPSFKRDKQHDVLKPQTSPSADAQLEFIE